HAYARGPDRMTERLETAARVDRDVAVDAGAPLLHELSALALLAEAEVLGVRDLRPGEAVVDLGEVDIRRLDARLFVCLTGGRRGAAKADVVEGRVVLWATGRDRERGTLHERVVVAEARCPVGAAEDRGGAAVGRRTAVEEAEGPGDHRCAEDLL